MLNDYYDEDFKFTIPKTFDQSIKLDEGKINVNGSNVETSTINYPDRYPFNWSRGYNTGYWLGQAQALGFLDSDDLFNLLGQWLLTQ